MDAVEVMVRVGLPSVENGVDGVLDVREVEFVLRQEPEVYPVDGAIPSLGISLADMSVFQALRVGLEIGCQSGEIRDRNETLFVPRIHQIVTGPVEMSGFCVLGHCKRKEA